MKLRGIVNLIAFLNRLEAQKIFYRLENKGTIQ